MEHLELNRDLGTILNQLITGRTKWYNIGIQLKISVDKLDCIKFENTENGHCLREMLKDWLKHHPHPVWRDIVNALRSGAVDECKLAEDIEKKYCSDDMQIITSRAEQADSISAHSPPSMETQHIPKEVSMHENLEQESGHSSESGTHLQKQGFKCGCGQCSLSSWLEIGCPNASEENMKYPFLDLDKFSYKDRIALEAKLNDECKKIQRKFSKLVYRTQGSLLERQVSVKQLASCLSDLGTYEAILPNKPVLFHCLEDICKAKDVYDVFWILKDYRSFFNYHVIEHIIDMLGTEKDAGNLDEYKKELELFLRRKVFECPENIFRTVGGDHKADLVVKIGKSEAETELCMSEVLSYQETVSKLLGLKTAALLLRHITKGCVQLTYQIPKFVVSDGEIFPLNIKQMVELQANGITKLKCENFDWECEPEIAEETDSEVSSLINVEQPQGIQLPSIPPPLHKPPPPSLVRSVEKPNPLRDPAFTHQARSYRLPEKNRRVTRKNVGIVIGDFQGIFGDELSLTIGERLEIISKDPTVSRNIGWWTGRNEKGRIGIFPSASVKIISKSNINEHNLPMEIPYNDIELKEVIGVGGFGKVHRAIYRQEEVAVKVAKYTTFDSLKAVQEVIAEAEKFAHLAHTNVCALVGVVLVKDVCLVMEYARGGSLSEVLHTKRIFLPIDVIVDWATQIAAGMMYLHHGAQPSVVHRNLKSSNILLANAINPNNLNGNIIKISDFGLAREFEDTADMSGAGTYPWMAPEVIRSNKFSKKSDVWSYAVVLWELLTGEQPYGGLNIFVVAYGVGHGTLSLPIPGGCPKCLSELMKACWARIHTNRPSFIDIHSSLQSIEDSVFFSATTAQDFQTTQIKWKEEIHRKFTELKKIETELQAHEDALQEKMEKQDKELQERKAAIEKRERQLQTQTEFLERKKKELEAMDKQKRPPRLNKFSLRRLIRWLSGPQEGPKRLGADGMPMARTEGLLPNQMKRPTKKTISYLGSLSESRKHTTPVTVQSPPLSQDSCTSSVTTKGDNVSREHRRQHSDDLPVGASKEQLQRIDSATTQRFQWRRASSPSPTSKSMKHGPVPTIACRIEEEPALLRSHSISEPRSRSPQLIRGLPPPRAPPDRSCAAGSIFTPVMATPMHPDPSTAVLKPTQLSFHKGKTLDSVDGSPSSPMMTVTSVEGYSVQHDSGQSSMNSDHMNRSEHHQELIKLESPTSTNATKTMFHNLAEFDPLQPNQYDSGRGSIISDNSDCTNCSEHHQELIKLESPTSTNATKMMFHHLSEFDLLQPIQYDMGRGSINSDNSDRTNCSKHHQELIKLESPTSTNAPKMMFYNLAEFDPLQGSGPSSSIVRPHPRPLGLSVQGDLMINHPISLPSSRSHSPRNLPAIPLHHYQGTATSPTNSVQSFGFQSDGDYISGASSLLDLSDLNDSDSDSIFSTSSLLWDLSDTNPPLTLPSHPATSESLPERHPHCHGEQHL